MDPQTLSDEGMTARGIAQARRLAATSLLTDLTDLDGGMLRQVMDQDVSSSAPQARLDRPRPRL